MHSWKHPTLLYATLHPSSEAPLCTPCPSCKAPHASLGNARHFTYGSTHIRKHTYGSTPCLLGSTLHANNPTLPRSNPMHCTEPLSYTSAFLSLLLLSVVMPEVRFRAVVPKRHAAVRSRTVMPRCGTRMCDMLRYVVPERCVFVRVGTQ